MFTQYLVLLSLLQLGTIYYEYVLHIDYFFDFHQDNTPDGKLFELLILYEFV